MTDKIIPILGRGGSTPAAPGPVKPQPKVYDFHFKLEGVQTVQAVGYPAFNGAICAVLTEPDDPLTINFFALASDLAYVQESDELEDLEA